MTVSEKKKKDKLEARKRTQQGNLKSMISFSKIVSLCSSPLNERDRQLSLSLLAKRAITRTSFEKGNYLRDHSQIPLSPRCSFLTWPTLLSGQFLATLAEYAETSLLAAAISFAKAMSSFLDRWGWPSSASLRKQWKVSWTEDFNIECFYLNIHVEGSDPKHTS